MHSDQLSALLDAAGEGVAFDGLDVAREDDGYVFETPERRREGLTEREFREACESSPWHVSNWYFWTTGEWSAADRAFLRWVEAADERSVPERYEALADGVSRTWGQLSIEAELGEDGRRRYHLRHEADADADLADLAVHTDLAALRELVRFDDRRRYRPVKTAPSLRTGWAYADLDGAALTEAVERVYPVTIANWHLERRGDLDVTHWRETAERQTGIYDVVDELDSRAVEWMAEACCVDSQCLKRRMWDEEEGIELDVPRGDGEFPCREPCSLVVAAARKWTTLEREPEREYTFTLTESEKEQVEEVIDAVADGRVDEIREADVAEGANRYRTRFLRAKRFDEDGNLCGVPTDSEGGEQDECGDRDASWKPDESPG